MHHRRQCQGAGRERSVSSVASKRIAGVSWAEGVCGRRHVWNAAPGTTGGSSFRPMIRRLAGGEIGTLPAPVAVVLLRSAGPSLWADRTGGDPAVCGDLRTPSCGVDRAGAGRHWWCRGCGWAGFDLARWPRRLALSSNLEACGRSTDESLSPLLRWAGVIPPAPSVLSLAVAIRIARAAWRGVTVKKSRQRYGHPVGHLPEQLDLVTGKRTALAAGKPFDADRADCDTIE